MIMMREKNCLFSIYFILLILLFSACGEDIVSTVDPPPPPPSYDLKIAKIEINTFNNTIVDEPKVRAMMTVTDIDSDQNEIADYNGIIGIELRGSTSQDVFLKKSYGIETWDNDNNDIDVSIFGFPEEEDWILNGPYSDKSLMRNVLIFDLSNAIGRYASRTKYCELFINNSYRGVYVFMEKLKRNDMRIDISKLNIDENSGEDLTGGYILKIDKASGNGTASTDYNSQNSFSSDYDTNGSAVGLKKANFLYEYPKAELITLEQKDYIQNYISEFEDALISPEYQDPINGYRPYIDVQSFVDYFILNEISHNPDGYRLSTFMYKDKGGKLHLGPIWDFNLAFGNVDYCEGAATNNWMFNFNNYCPQDFWQIHFWWKRLLADPYFTDQIKERYIQLRTDALSNQSIDSRINAYADQLENSGAVNGNFARWNILGSYVWPNNFVGPTYASEVQYLKNWITERLQWMDQNVPLL